MTNNALKFSILITVFITLLFLVITIYCLFKCVVANKNDVHAISKATEIAEAERAGVDQQAQFAPIGESARDLYAAVTTPRKKIISKIKGQDDDVVNADKPSD